MRSAHTLLSLKTINSVSVEDFCYDRLAVYSGDFELMKSTYRGMKNDFVSDNWNTKSGNVSFHNTPITVQKSG
jgi:hypothetical protein